MKALSKYLSRSVRRSVVNVLQFTPGLTGALMMTAGVFAAPAVGYVTAVSLMLPGAAVVLLGTVAVMVVSDVFGL